MSQVMKKMRPPPAIKTNAIVTNRFISDFLNYHRSFGAAPRVFALMDFTLVSEYGNYAVI